MIGILDVGGGLRGIYTSGIYDYLIDNGVDIEYCIGVSSGSANLITYIAGQSGRTKKFYDEYSYDKEYMGVGSYLKKGMLINLDYIYSDITNSTGKDPVDYDAAYNSPKFFKTLATNAITGEPRYFTKADIERDEYTLFKACCAIPVACRKPIKFKGEEFFDGGLSDPFPIDTAFADGCEKLIVCITQPIDFRKEPMTEWLVKLTMRKYPVLRDRVLTMHNAYNENIERIIELEKQGKVLVVYPRECFGIDTLARDKEVMQKLYELGYEDGKKIEDYVNKYRAEKLNEAK